MVATHEVLSEEYVSSQTKRNKQAKNLFTVFAVLFGAVSIVQQFVLGGSGTDFLIVVFVSFAISRIIQGRQHTLLENKRLWDRGRDS